MKKVPVIHDVPARDRLKKRRPRFLPAWILLTGIAVAIACQALYFSWIVMAIRGNRPLIGDAVVVYGGDPSRIPAGFRVAEEVSARWIVFSGSDDAAIREGRRRMTGRCSVQVVGGAYTTDQNARTVVPVLKKAGVKSAILVTSWYHLPRAYFLTRLYAIGSGIEWSYASAEPVPAKWWRRPEFLREFPRFWGSLFRVGLSLVGVHNWPRPSGFKVCAETFNVQRKIKNGRVRCQEGPVSGTYILHLRERGHTAGRPVIFVGPSNAEGGGEFKFTKTGTATVFYRECPPNLIALFPARIGRCRLPWYDIL